MKVVLFSLILITPIVKAESPWPKFVNIAPQAGLTTKMTSGDLRKPFLPESMSGGAAFIDYDNDGWIDIYLVNGSSIEAYREGNNTAENQLYRNNRNGTFTDVTGQAGVGDRGWGMGVCAGDVNNDGWEDLFVTNIGPNILYMNQGDGTFRQLDSEAWKSDQSWSSSCGFGDYDNDGDLDLYVSNYVDFDFINPPVEGPMCQYRGVKVQCGPRGLPGAGDKFYENQGEGTFLDKTAAAGIEQPEKYFGLGVIWADYDADGDLDIFVANDSVPNFLFQNNGDKTFFEMGLLTGVSFNEDGKEQAGMGVDFADFDNDGDLDLMVTNFSDDNNTLYQNEGTGQFLDVTYRARLGDVSWQKLGWGIAFIDLDLDGWKDIVIVNGHVYPEVNNYEIGTSFKQQNLVFRNLGNGQFEEMTSQSGLGFEEIKNSRALLPGDINNDGQLDFLITNLDEEPSLLLNDSSAKGHWLIIKLVGRKSNRTAVGSEVTVRTPGMRQFRAVVGGGGYQSQNDYRLHFGVASNETVEAVEIKWPDGRLQKLENVKSNQILRIEEPVE
ncbi:MAG: CRTAC1 family protein [Acidobacteriota bacterium]|nr:MAG: CRTAC1 family protein [Acidobacteriota bacterium]